MDSEKMEPQIKAPRVTPLEGVSTYAPQGFGIDERKLNALSRLLNLAMFVEF